MNSGENNKDTAFPSKLKTIVTMEKAILTQHHTLPLTLKPNWLHSCQPGGSYSQEDITARVWGGSIVGCVWNTSTGWCPEGNLFICLNHLHWELYSAAELLNMPLWESPNTESPETDSLVNLPLRLTLTNKQDPNTVCFKFPHLKQQCASNQKREEYHGN